MRKVPLDDPNVLYKKYLDRYTPDICARILLVCGLLQTEDYSRPGVITQKQLEIALNVQMCSLQMREELKCQGATQEELGPEPPAVITWTAEGTPDPIKFLAWAEPIAEKRARKRWF